MEAYIIIALLLSLVGGVGTAAGKILYQSYREERLYLEASDEAPTPIYYPHPEAEPAKKKLSPHTQTWDFINSHEGGWLADIIQRPLLVYGSPGSGKTSFAAYLALLRHLLKDHQLEICDPRYGMNKYTQWKDLADINIPAFGAGGNYQEIGERLDAMYQRLKVASPDKGWFTTIFDEVTKYSFESGTKEAASNLILTCLVDCRGGREAPILISHGNTSALTGNAEGVHQSKKEGIAQLHLLSTSKNGEYHPLFKGQLIGIPDENGCYERHITIHPQMMTTNYLMGLFNVEIAKKEMVEPDKLGEPLATVLEFAKRHQGFVKAAEVQRNNANLIDKETSRKISTQRIRRYFGLLSDMGYGELQGEGDRMKFKAY